MKIDRVILDIFSWIKKILWKNEQNNKLSYTVISTITGIHGVIKRVERETPRAVDTYVFSPFQPNMSMNATDSAFDYHICLDFLGVLDANTNERSAKSYKYKKQPDEFVDIQKASVYNKTHNTHTVTIIKSSRWVNKDGEYIGEVLFQKEYDFVGRWSYFGRDRLAVPIFRSAISRLKTLSPLSVKWDEELTKATKKFIQD